MDEIARSPIVFSGAAALDTALSVSKLDGAAGTVPPAVMAVVAHELVASSAVACYCARPLLFFRPGVVG
jgi:hypothetical protein